MSKPSPAVKQCDFPGCKYETIYCSALRSHKKTHNRVPTVQCGYACKQCSFSSTTSAGLRSHIIRRHTNNYPFTCSVAGCSYKAKMFSDLQNHEKNRHATPHPSKIICTFEGCNYKTKFSKELKRHVLTRHTPNRKKSIECPLCQQRFFTAGHMRDHLMTHTKEKPWKCSQCDYDSKCKGHLLRHVESAHGELETTRGKRVSKCDLCDFSTTFAERLKAHVYSHTNDQPYACKFSGCKFRSKWKQHLETHEIRDHDPERHPCPHPGCKYVARHNTQLRCHISGVHRKQFPCEFPDCNRQCMTETALINHQKLHDPERLFECEHCRLRFKTKNSLQSHLRQCHWEEKHLQCPHCDYTTNQRASLRSHLRRVHQAEDIMCTEPGCNFKSCSPFDMMKHSERHDNKSHPFKCEFCPLGFMQEEGLTKQVKREHSNVPKESPWNRSTTSNPANLPFRNDCKPDGSGVMNIVFSEGHLCHRKVPIVVLAKIVIQFPFSAEK